MAFHFDIEESKVLKGVFVIKPDKFKDLRGEIWTAFTQEQLASLAPVPFKHDKFITSHKDVIRGIHGDTKTYKLATCLYGEILQVVVDCRPQSPTYLKYESFVINPANQLLVLVPKGFGNAHLVRSEQAVYYYKCAYEGEYVDAPNQFTYAWDDERIGVKWGVEKPILSVRDMQVSEK